MSQQTVQWNKHKSVINTILDMQNELNDLTDKQNNSIFIHGFHYLKSWDNFIDCFIKKFDLGKHYSKKTIGMKFSLIFNDFKPEDIINNAPNIARKLMDLGDELASTLGQEKIFIFKTKLIHTDKTYIFENITICNGKQKSENNESVREQCLTFLNTLNENYSDIAEEKKQEFSEFINDTTEETVILIKETGDKILSKAKALDKARTFINEIAFFADLCHMYSTLPSLEIDEPNKSNLIKIDVHEKIIGYASVEDDTLIPILFTLDENFQTKNNNILHFRDFLKKYDFPICQKVKENEVLSKVSIAISWYAKARRSLDIHTKFLFCCIGLEALFSQNGNPVSETLASNCALLLGNSVDNRMDIKAKVKTLYNSRSGIAHGRREEIQNIQLVEVFNLLSVSILKIISLSKENKISTNDEINRYFERQKMDSSSFNKA